MRIACVVSLASCALLFSGCSAAPNFESTSNNSGSTSGVALEGRVHGGQQPITGATVYLYAVANTGYGIASTSLLKTPGSVTTDSNGNFSITGDYNCPTGAQVYIYAVGGNPGLAGGTNNTAAGLLAGLGPCSALSSSTSIFVNEVSTIATAYALAGYATDATHISSSSSTLAATGVANAFSSITNLETLKTGAALATTPSANGGNGTVPQSEIDTLANILAACINTTGPGSTACSTLLSNAKNGSTTPTDTATAAINIAHNPGANISSLFALQTASSPFMPDLSAAPNDFTIAVIYTGGGLYSPEGVAIDGSGDIWVASSSLGGSINEFKPNGAPVSGSSGFTGGGLDAPYGILIDTTGNVWASNLDGNSLSEFNPATGNPVSSTGSSGAGHNEPEEITIDPSGHIWAANFGGDSLSEFNSSNGSPVSPSAFTGGGLYAPLGLAVDTSAHLWIANTDGNVLSEFNTSNGQAVSADGYTGSLSYPFGVAVDGSGNVWVANEGVVSASSISEFGSSGTVSSNSPITGGGLNEPIGLAIDGAGNVWTANLQGDTVSEFSPAGAAISPSTGYGFLTAGLNDPFWIAIDGSGNVWVTNSSVIAKSLTEFVGAASPVVTPVVANLIAPYGAKAVNKP